MALTNQARMDIDLGRGGSYSLSRDVLKHHIWDILPVPSQPGTLTFFTGPIGSTTTYSGTIISTKSRRETNLRDNSKLPNGQTFLIKRIGIFGFAPSFNQTYGTNTYFFFMSVLQNSVFDIFIAGREADYQVNGRQFVPNEPLLLGTNPGGDVVGHYAHSGWLDLRPCPIFVDQLVSFQVRMRIGAGDSGVANRIRNAMSDLNNNYGELMVVLEGTLTRAK